MGIFTRTGGTIGFFSELRVSLSLGEQELISIAAMGFTFAFTEAQVANWREVS
jgi:hypothetical protein